MPAGLGVVEEAAGEVGAAGAGQPVGRQPEMGLEQTPQVAGGDAESGAELRLVALVEGAVDDEPHPYGGTISYGELARRVGRPGASRAVGAANGRNPISIVVPCHRVIGADGRLTGYGWGNERKAWLLDHEGADRLIPRTMAGRR